MHHAAHVAEHQPTHQKPPGEHRQRGLFGAVESAAYEQVHAERGGQQCRGQQPGDLIGHLGGEEPARPRRCAHFRPAVSETGRPGIRRLVPGPAQDAGHAVVTKGQLQHGVVCRPADVGPRGGRDELDSQHPPACGGDQRGSGPEQMQQSPAPGRRRQQQVGDGEGRQRKEARQHLGEKCRAHCEADQREPAPRRRLDGTDHAVTADRQHQDQQRVGVVEAEDERRSRRACQRGACKQTGHRSLACIGERPANR